MCTVYSVQYQIESGIFGENCYALEVLYYNYECTISDLSISILACFVALLTQRTPRSCTDSKTDWNLINTMTTMFSSTLAMFSEMIA